MSYRIIYGRTEVNKKKRIFWKRIKFGNRIVVVLCSVILLIVFMTCFPGNINILRELLLPGDADVTSQALENMVDHIVQGDSVQAALVTFCRKIIGGAA